MYKTEKQTDLIYRLDNKINKGIKVIFFNCNNIQLAKDLNNRMVQNGLQDYEIWNISNGLLDDGMKYPISAMESEKLKKIYYLYDFSDKVLLLGEDSRYGTLFNYVKTGILTNQEMFDALLYKI